MNPQPQPSHERIGSIRQTIYQEDAYLIERVNAGMGEWEYVIRYCGKYYATAPTENIARDIVERAQRSRPAPTAFVPMASNELRDLCAKEWQNRAERKQLAYDHRSWVSGWYDGYFCKPDIREHDATIRNEILDAIKQYANTCIWIEDDFCPGKMNDKEEADCDGCPYIDYPNNAEICEKIKSLRREVQE